MRPYVKIIFWHYSPSSDAVPLPSTAIS